MANNKKAKKKIKQQQSKKWKVLKALFIFVVLPIICTAIYEGGKIIYLKKYPLKFSPSTLTIDSDVSSRYFFTIQNRSDNIIGPTLLHVAFDNISLNQDKYVTLRLKQVKQNNIIPYLNDTIWVIMNNDGKLQFTFMEDTIASNENLQFVIEFPQITYDEHLHIKSNVEFGYQLNKLAFQYGGNKEAHRKKEGEARKVFDLKKLKGCGTSIKPEPVENVKTEKNTK